MPFFRKAQVIQHYNSLISTTSTNAGTLQKHTCHEGELYATPNYSKPFIQGHTFYRDMLAITPCTIKRPLDVRYSAYPVYKNYFPDPPGKSFQNDKLSKSFHFQNKPFKSPKVLSIPPKVSSLGLSRGQGHEILKEVKQGSEAERSLEENTKSFPHSCKLHQDSLKPRLLQYKPCLLAHHTQASPNSPVLHPPFTTSICHFHRFACFHSISTQLHYHAIHLKATNPSFLFTFTEN